MSNDKTEASKEDFSLNCKKLKLSQAFADRAFSYEGEMDNVKFVQYLVQAETERRALLRIYKLTGKAGFPYLCTADMVDCSGITFPQGVTWDSLMNLSFCNEKRPKNIVMVGPPRTGKSTASIAVGNQACQMSIPTMFYKTDDIMGRLQKAEGEGRFADFMEKHKRVKVVIFDEFAYVPYSLEQTRLFFRFLSNMNDHASIILNTITEFSKWKEMLSDERLAASMAGKVMDNSILLIFNGRPRNVTHD